MGRKYFGVLIIMVLTLAFSCSENRKNMAGIRTLESSILLFGVGYDQDMAETDLNSVFYAFNQGFTYRFSEEGLSLRLDYSNKSSRISVQDLTYARLKKLMDNFYIYELPYKAMVNIRGGSEKRISETVTIKKPSGFLARMLTTAVMEELGKTHKENETGYIYLTSLNYAFMPDKSLVINADLLLTREL